MGIRRMEKVVELLLTLTPNLLSTPIQFTTHSFDTFSLLFFIIGVMLGGSVGGRVESGRQVVNKKGRKKSKVKSL
jgi:hypothetical protein